MTLPLPAVLSIATLAAHALLCVWHAHHRAFLLRTQSAQLNRVERRVNELSDDRTKAAAAVVQLFAATTTGGERCPEPGVRRLRSARRAT